MSAKLTVLRGVVRCEALRRLMAARVMSCSWRADEERAAELRWVEVRGVKNFWKRFGVMGGGFLSLRLAVVVTCGGGELGSSDEKRWTQGEEDMAATLTLTLALTLTLV